MSKPRKLRTKADWLILGAGMAGCGAVVEARRLGLNYIVLEARDRVGGRIRTVRPKRVAHYPVELGAEFVHGAAMKALCDNLGLSLHQHPSDGDVYADGERHPMRPVLDVFQLLRQLAALHLQQGGEDCSVASFLDTVPWDELHAPTWVTKHLVGQLIRNDYAVRVSDLGLAGLLAPDVDGYEDNYRIREGYDEVPKRILAGAEIRLRHHVTAILRTRAGVEVLTNRGVYTANVVIVCLPLGVLQRGAIRFDPELSTAKTLALQTLNPGQAAKLVLCFRRTKMGTTFWPAGTPLLGTALTTQLWWPTGWGYDETRYFLASCLVGGAGVRRFAEREPRRAGLVQLAHMFSRDKVEKNALDTFFIKAWHDDPLTWGGYTSWPAREIGATVLADLEAAEDVDQPQLFFAGDYVSPHPGSAYSAYLSGMAAVQRALQNARS